MENHITSKGEKERMFLEIKENKSYILTPWECVFPWGFTVRDNKVLTTFLIVFSAFLCERITD